MRGESNLRGRAVTREDRSFLALGAAALAVLLVCAVLGIGWTLAEYSRWGCL